MIQRYRDFLARNPQSWTLLLSACAWISLWKSAYPAHTMEASMMSANHAALCSTSWWSNATHWAVMTTAMMVPLVANSAQTVALRSLWTRRHRAIVLFLLVYVGSWVLAGLFLTTAFDEVRQGTSDRLLLPMILSAAAVWELTPLKEHALRRCHRTEPLAPIGWRADWTCLRFGFRHGSMCVLSCWALMLVPMALQHSLLAMAGVGLIALTDRASFDRKPRKIAGALLAAAALSAVVGLTTPS